MLRSEVGFVAVERPSERNETKRCGVDGREGRDSVFILRKLQSVRIGMETSRCTFTTMRSVQSTCHDVLCPLLQTMLGSRHIFCANTRLKVFVQPSSLHSLFESLLLSS